MKINEDAGREYLPEVFSPASSVMNLRDSRSYAHVAHTRLPLRWWLLVDAPNAFQKKPGRSVPCAWEIQRRICSPPCPFGDPARGALPGGRCILFDWLHWYAYFSTWGGLVKRPRRNWSYVWIAWIVLPSSYQFDTLLPG